MISMPLSQIERRAKKWAKALGDVARVIDGESMVGGGSLPGGTLPTKLVTIGSRKDRTIAQEWGRRLRQLETPIIGRISEDVLLLDPRSVLPEEDEIVLRGLQQLAVK
jgi:L-seryl-tRNA(Ser) seleniumtransferase